MYLLLPFRWKKEKWYTKDKLKFHSIDTNHMKTGIIFLAFSVLLHSGHFFVTLIACLMQIPQKIWPHVVEWGCLPTEESIQTAHSTVFFSGSGTVGTLGTVLLVLLFNNRVDVVLAVVLTCPFWLLFNVSILDCLQI